jgi:acyl-CoA synthetase (NDP forming)
MPDAAQKALKERLPFASPRNPVDVTAHVFNDMSLVEANMRIMLEQGGYDAVLAFWTSLAGAPSMADKLIAAVRAGSAGFKDRLIVHSLVAPPEIIARYEAEGFSVFEDPTRAIAAIAALMHFGAAFGKGAGVAPPLLPAVSLPEGPLGEREAKAVLAAAGLPLIEDRLATSAAEAEAAARAFGGSVALKIASPDIAHKTEVGGVALNVATDEAAEMFKAMVARVAEAAPSARIDGVLVSPMVTGGVECILGAKIDPVFGPIVMFGLGGVFAEALKDISLRRAPIGREDGRAMIDELKGSALLKGARGAPPADLDALASAIAALSRFAAANADIIESVEINPVRALSDSIIGLDALIVKRAGAP